MSTKYELSLWREYPGANAIQEEKVCVIAATGVDSSGRAQDIKLKKEYNGKQTLTFDIPIKYFDVITGEDVANPLVEQVIDHSKLKLWRDELWWNPFAVNKGIDETTGCTIFEGDFVQGRWYEFIVTDRKQKRSKKQLMYSYSCDSLFMNELSRTGYNLEFVPDTDIMSASGMGTAHELAKRIVDGTDWQYIKTEVFPDYKEEYNPVTGETVKVPVSTDQIEFAKGLDRYLYCYTLKIDDEDRQNEILNEIGDLTEDSNGNPIFLAGTHFGFENNVFWWKPQYTDEPKKYIYGYNKTDIITSYADRVLCYTSGLITKGISEEKIEEATLLNSTSLWEGINGSDPEAVLINDGEEQGANYYLRYSRDTTPEGICNSGYSDTPLEKGEHLIVKLCGGLSSDGEIIPNSSSNINLYIYDGNPENSSTFLTFSISIDKSTNCYNNNYILTLPKRIKNPYFVISSSTTIRKWVIITGMFIYKFVGANKQIDSNVKEWISTQTSYTNKISNLPAEYIPSNVTEVDLSNNTCKIDGAESPFWLPVGTMAQNNFKNGTDVFCIEFNNRGEYIDIYPTLNKEELTKISSYGTDKRRSISGSKSNRYSLLETISKTFFCFTRFVVEHDDNGYIKTDSAGRPLKYFTYVSELGRRNFNGFTYGVNLEGIERKIDSKSLVTKVYVENIDNQYDNSGIITIQNSDYNKMGERFFYNFSYYARQGFFNNSQFMKDYKETYELVGLLNARAKEANEIYVSKEQFRQTKKTAYETHNMLLSSYIKNANEELQFLKWPRLIEKISEITDGDYDESDVTFPTINWRGIMTILAQKVMLPELNPYEYIAHYMYEDRYDEDEIIDGSEAWVGSGVPENDIESSLRSVGVAQTQYNNLYATVKKERQELTNITEEVNVLLEEYNNLLEQKNRKLEWFEKKYHRFILEGQWSGQDYIEPDTYYLDATRAMATSCMPKVSYSSTVIDLSNLCNPYDPTDEDWGKDFIYDVGDTTYIKDEELFGNLEQKSMISEINVNIDTSKPDDITLTNFETRFEELFQSIAAAVTTLQLNENIYSRAENFTPEGTIDVSILQKSFNENKNLVISSSNNKVTQDNNGITIRTDDDSGQVLRAIAGGIFLSKDNGKTFTAGLTADGFNANLITAGQIDTSKIVIRSSEVPQYSLDELGLTAYSVAANSSNLAKRETNFVRFDQFGVYSTEKGRLFGKNWWKGLQETTEIETNVTKEYNLITDAVGSKLLRRGEADNLSYPDNLIYSDIEAIYGNDWDVAINISDIKYNTEIKKVWYYRSDLYYNGDYVEPLSTKSWQEGDNWAISSANWPPILIEKEVVDIVNYGNYLVFKNINVAYEYSDYYGSPGWTGGFRILYANGVTEISLGSPEDYIENYSVFSLTRKGLRINSSGGENVNGYINISTENPEVACYDGDENIRVKMGYLPHKDIYGLDIYDGCISVFSSSYKPGEVPSEDDRVFYFDSSKGGLVVKGRIETNSGKIGNWNIGSTGTLTASGDNASITLNPNLTSLSTNIFNATYRGNTYFSVGYSYDENMGIYYFHPATQLGSFSESWVERKNTITLKLTNGNATRYLDITADSEGGSLIILTNRGTGKYITI